MKKYLCFIAISILAGSAYSCYGKIIPSAGTNTNGHSVDGLQGNSTLKELSQKHAFSFVENKGQITDQNKGRRTDIQYKLAAGAGLNIFIGNGALHYQFSKPESNDYTMYRMDVELVGANRNATIITAEAQEYYESYLTASTAQNGITAHAFNKIIYKDIYPQIDWVLFTANGQLKHEFVVREGGKVSDIRLKYGGAKSLNLNSNGSLTAMTPLGMIDEQAPRSFVSDGSLVESRFILKGDVLSYETGKYQGTLIIDPTLMWATYFGGTGYDQADCISVDGSGNIYIGGWSASLSSIATAGAYQTTIAGSVADAYLAKFNSAGTLLWGTYFGGTDLDEVRSIFADGLGSVYIAGHTKSLTTIATAGAHQTTYGGTGSSTYGSLGDGFLARFTSSGSLIWSTYYGGTGSDFATGVTVDAVGDIYIVGNTGSAAGIATAGSHQPAKASGGGAPDAFLAKFNASGVRLWATYFGGTSDEDGNAVTTDGAGNVYITGNTQSGVGLSTAGAYQTISGGYFDAFLVKFNSSGVRQWSTYYGGTDLDEGFGLATDGGGNIYISGHTASTAGIASAGAHQTVFGGGTSVFGGDAFLVKFSTAGARLWSTYYGGVDGDWGRGVHTDAAGYVYLAGRTYSVAGIASTGAYQGALSANDDAFFAIFNSAGVRQYGTYYGGVGSDVGYGISGDGAGKIYIAGSTASSAAIATAGAYQSTIGGSTDAFIAKFDVCVLPVPGTISGTSSVCAGSSITLTPSVSGGSWSSSDASIATVTSSGFVSGIAAGTAMISYTVSNTCASASTTMVITVNALPVAGTISGPSAVCVSAAVTLTGSAPGGVWSSTAPGIASISSGGLVTGIAPGTTTISYTVTNSCGTVAATYGMTVNAAPDAGTVSGPSSVCIGSSIALGTTISGGTWSVTNATASVSSGGMVSGLAIGTDTVIYTVINGCGTDTVQKVVAVSAGPPTGTITGLSTVCVSATITLSNSVTGGAWSCTNTNATISSGGVVTGAVAGIDTVVYTVIGSCGAATTTKVITVNPLPFAGVISGSSTVCVSSSISLSSSVAGGTWSSGSANATVSSGGVVSGVTTGTATISYSYTNMCGTDVATMVVTVITVPAAGTVSGASTVCIGSSILLTPTVSGGTWGSSSGNATVTSGGSVSGISAGTANITYTVTNSCGSSFATHMVTVGIPPSAGTITGPSSVCVGASVTVADAVTGGTWSVTNTNATITSGGSVTGMTAGIDTIVYTITAACGATYARRAITVNPLPTGAIISGVPSVCIGASVGFSASIPGGIWGATTGNASVTTGGTVTGLTVGTDIISYTVTNSCGTASATYPVSVNTIPAAGTILGPSNVCVGGTITLFGSVAGGTWSISGTSATISAGGVVSGVSAGVETVTYTVTNGCGSASATRLITVNVVTPAAGTIVGVPAVCVGTPEGYISTVSGGTWSSSATNFTISSGGLVTGTSAGVGNITYTVSNACGSSIAIKELTINPLPLAGTITGPDSVCVGKTNILSDVVSGGVWSAVNARASVSSSGLVTGVSVGIDTIVYTTINLCGSASTKFPLRVLGAGACTVPTTSLDELVGSQVVSVFPNPNSGMFSVRTALSGNEPVSCVITNVLGQKVMEFRMAANDVTAIRLAQPAGIYFLAVTAADLRQNIKMTIE